MSTPITPTNQNKEVKMAIAEAEYDEHFTEDALADFGAELPDDYDELSPEALANPWSPPVEFSAMSKPTGKGRDDKQLAVDAKVLESYNQWQRVGRPADWDSAVRTGCVFGYWLAKAKIPEVKKLVVSAGARHKVKVVYGTNTPRASGMVQDGRLYFSCYVEEKPPSKPRQQRKERNTQAPKK